VPDISLCMDNECPARSRCYRHTASGTKPSEFWQAYSAFKHDPDKGRCAEFWPINAAARVVERKDKEAAK
jgi:hypothetical protein